MPCKLCVRSRQDECVLSPGTQESQSRMGERPRRPMLVNVSEVLRARVLTTNKAMLTLLGASRVTAGKRSCLFERETSAHGLR